MNIFMQNLKFQIWFLFIASLRNDPNDMKVDDDDLHQPISKIQNKNSKNLKEFWKNLRFSEIWKNLRILKESRNTERI